MHKLHHTLMDVLYKATRNLRARLEMESRALNELGQSDPSYAKQHERLGFVQDRFNASIVQLDQFIMMFQSF
jgi:hypothetical protein